MDRDPWSDVRCYELRNVEDTEEELGKGAYGVVKSMRMGQLSVAGKFLYGMIADGVVKEKFIAECHILSRLKHPHVVQFLGLYWMRESRGASELPALIMEKLPYSLSHLLEERKRTFPSSIKLSILLDVAQGLCYLHEQGIMHRDLSANNVLLTASLRAKIGDLGVARLVDPEEARMRMSARNCMSVTPGTPRYMPPETYQQPGGGQNYSTPIDIFSFGVLVLHCYKQGWPERREFVPVPGESKYYSKAMNQECFQPDFDTFLPDGHPLRTMTMECLSDNPEQRPTANQLVTRLTELHEEDPSPLRDPLGLLDELSYLKQEWQHLREKYKTYVGQDLTTNPEGRGLEHSQQQEEEKGKGEEEDEVAQLKKRILDLETERLLLDKHMQDEREERRRVQQELKRLKGMNSSPLPIIPPPLSPVSEKHLQKTDISLLVRKVPQAKSSLKHIHQAQAVVIKGKVYVGRKTSFLWVYDTLQGKWWQHPGETPVRNYAIANYRDQLVLVGGAQHSTLSKKVYVWREGEGTWDGDMIPEMAEEREEGVALGYEQYLLVMGGSSAVSWLAKLVTTYRKSVDIFDGNSWSQGIPLIQNSILLQSVSHGRFLYLLHPESGLVHYCSTETLILSSQGGLPASEKKFLWKTLEQAAPYSRCCIAVLGDCLLAIAGAGSRGSIFAYDPASQLWSRFTRFSGSNVLPSLRNATCAELTPSQLFLCGGDVDMVTDVEESQLAFTLSIT